MLLYIMMFDVMHFQQFNGPGGRLVGDFVLKSLLAILASAFSLADLISRYGAEEFIGLLNNIVLQNCLPLTKK